MMLRKVLFGIVAMPLFFGPFQPGLAHEAEENDVVLQQWSPFLNEWEGVVLFYGYGLNDEMCEKVKDFLNANRYEREVHGRKNRCVPLSSKH